MLPVIAAVAALLAQVISSNAHGGVVNIGVDGTKYPGWSPYNSASGQTTAARPYSSFDPILSATASTMHCNNNGGSGPNQQTLTIAAGGTITAYYSQWTHAEGPFTVYLAACPSSGCTGTSSAGLQWFKIAEQGLISGTVGKGQWANGLLMKNLSWSTKIPTSLRAGHYLIRWETLALHQANTPQFYPECAQIQVTGGGSDFPTSQYLKPIPGAWGANDPGVNINIYDAVSGFRRGCSRANGNCPSDHCSTDYIHHPWTSNLPCIQVDERLLYIALCFPFKIKCWRIVQKLYTKAETVVPLILKCIVRNRPLDKGEGSRFYIYERRNLLVSIRHWEIAAGTMHAYLSFEATRSLNQHRTRIFGVELINACLVCLCGFSSHDESIIRLSSGQAMKRSVHYQNEFSTYAVIRF